MADYLISNKTCHNISLEDCGVVLQSFGQAVVPESRFKVSRSIKEFESMITWKRIVNPTAWFKPEETQETVRFASAPAKPHAEPRKDKLDLILEKMDTILENMSHGQTVHVVQSNVPNVNVTAGKFEEPLFIPKDLVPHQAEATVNVSSAESDRPDINEAANMLKALKKSKKSKVTEGD